MKATHSMRSGVLLALATLLLAACARSTASTTPTPEPAPAAATAPAASAGTPTSSLPAARDLINRYVQAIGGRDALLRHRSFHEMMTIQIPAAGVNATGEAFAAHPNKSLQKMNFPGMGELVEGFDGEVAWSINPVQGPRVMSGKQLEQRRYRSAFNAALHEEESIKSLETVELTDFEGQKAYKVRVVRTNGDEAFEYFDASSGLMIGQTSSTESEMGQVTSTVVMSDYKQFGDVRMPSKVVVRPSVGPEFIMTVTEVHFDAVPPSTFDLPPQIKALVGK